MSERFGNQEETSTVSEELVRLWNLTWPVSATFFLNMSLNAVSVLFVGHLGASELAAAALATSLAQTTGNSVVRGVASAMNTLCGQSYGAGAYEMVGVQLQRASIIVGITCLPIITAWAFSEPLLTFIVQEKQLAHMTAAYLRYRIPGLLLYGSYICTSNWLQAQGIVQPAAVTATIVALLNPFINYFTIHLLGMNYLGAALATTCAYGLQLLLLWVLVLFLQIHKKTWGGWSRESLREWVPYLRLATPGLLLMSELWASEVAVMMAGLLRDPATALSASAIYQTINGLYFMLPLGLGASAAIRVANELGAGQPMRAKRAAELAVAASAISMTLLVVPVLPCRGAWARAFTNDVKVAQLVAQLLLVLLPYVVFDGIQTVVTGVMRGQGRQASVVPVVLVCYYVVGLPLSYILAFKFQLQALGLCLGMLVGTVLHALVFLYLMPRADWEQDALDAQLRAGILVCLPSEDPDEDIFHSDPSLFPPTLAVELSGGMESGEGQEHDR
eukprot:jgi/Botrbrau1/23325/Bobra.0102s0059.1